MIKTLVISESVFQVFNNLTHSNGTDLRAFWKHSLSTALLAKEIAGKTLYPNSEEAYLAGLLRSVRPTRPAGCRGQGICLHFLRTG